MWEDANYCWAVLCKNHWYHLRQNLFFRHKIRLAVTNAFAPLPHLTVPFKVRCDECGKAYLYKPSEVVRIEQEPPETFTPHPLFLNESADEVEDSESNHEGETSQAKQKRAKGA